MKILSRLTVCAIACLLFFSTAPAAQQAIPSALRDKAERAPAPPFQLVDGATRTVRLSDFRGKAVALNLWATECGGCKTELPAFVKLDRTYRKSGLAVVGVSMDVRYSDLKSASAGWVQVKPFLRSHNIQYPILLDDGSVEKAFAVTALPATYLLDRTGRIAATYLGVVDPVGLENDVKRLLAERVE